MATDFPAGDPRVASPAAASEQAEASVRPVVAVPRSGPSGLVLVIAAIVAAAILFVILDGRRRSLAQPSVRVRAADASSAAAPPPPLYIPPAAPVATVVALPAPVPTVVPLRQLAPAPAPQRQAPPQIVYVPQPYPAPANTPPQQVSPPRNAAGPTLVVDNTAAGSGPSGGSRTEDLPPGVSSALGIVQSGGRVRTGTVANRSTTVLQGTLIPAVLETAFDSTRPGLARAIVSRDVRGFDGKQVLIPRGSRLSGEYRSEVGPGQNRALVNWTRLVRPDGVTVAIASPTGDPLGRGGIRANVNSHFLERFAGALLQSTLDLGVNLATRAASGNVILALPGSTQSAAPSLIQNNRVARTLTVAAGTSISIFVAHDLDFTGAGGRQ
jgi:type IV secretion system protein VirB10